MIIFAYIKIKTERTKYLRIIGVLKVFRIRKFSIYFRKVSETWELSALECKIIEYSVHGILLIHWMACIHYTIPNIVVENYPGRTLDEFWIGKYLLLDFSYVDQYIRSIYLAGQLLFNVSYGMFEPTTELQLVMSILTFIIGNIYVAIILSAESKYREITNQVQEYMRCKQLPINMQKRLMSYYEYRFQKKYFREDLILASLSVRLRREINVYCYRRLIESVSIFKNMPQHLVVDVVNSLKEEIFLPNDIIVKANSIGDCMYFIASGTVCVTTCTGKEDFIALVKKNKTDNLKMHSKHVCTLETGSESNLPQVSNPFSRVCRNIRKLTIVSPTNKQCKRYFRSGAAISLERKRHVQSKLWYIIHPFSVFRLYWETSMTVLLFFIIILNALDDAFKMSKEWSAKSVVILLLEFACFLDIMLKFITGYENECTKEIILDPLKIAKKHFTSPLFYLEVITNTPMIIFAYIKIKTERTKYLRIIGVLKVFRIRKFSIYFRKVSETWELSALECKIIEYSVHGILLIHWMACIHYTIPNIVVENYPGRTLDEFWIGKYLLLDFSYVDQYIRSIYLAGQLLFNVSYGMFEPTTELQLVMSILTFIIGNIYVAIILSAESKYREITNQVQEYMRCKQLPINMQKRLMSYYEYRFQKKYFREDLILASLSVRLRREINVYCYRRLIESVSIFKNMPQHLVVDVVNSLKEEIFLPNDIIVKANSIGDCMYFIASGTVCVTTCTGKEICHLYDGAYFGEVALLMKDQKRIANVYALETCQIYRLDLKKNKTDNLKMHSKHVCTLETGSESNLPQVSNPFSRVCRNIRKLTIVSPTNKQCKRYFRSGAAISLERKRHVQSKLWYIIHPFSVFRLYWETSMTVLLFFIIILNALDDAFKMSKEWSAKSVVILLLEFACFLDIMLKFITGYENECTKEIILDPLKIAKKHFTSPLFYLEVITNTPMIIFAYIKIKTERTKYLRIIGVLKVFRIRKFSIYFRKVSETWELSALECKIIEYSVHGILLIHWMACIHYTIPNIVVENYPGRSLDEFWIGKYLLLDFSYVDQYIRSIYLAGQLLFNVSYGMFEPTTELELVMSILTFIIGNIYVAIILSAESKYREITNQVQEYMRCKQLPINMQKRLMSYYEYRFQKKYFREDLILASLSVRLRREINVYCYRRLIESVSIFKNMPQHLVVDVVNSLKEEIFLPNDIIVKANSIGDCMYFIASGTVCVTTCTGKEICHLYDGAYFGEVALLMKDQKRIANVYALETCQIYRLDRKQFRTCFSHNTDLYKKLEKTANIRLEKTAILEELHKKYLLSLETPLL
ncbi:hypothetical protein RN001_011001 [Aquatica leii]|uniref:Cyclic nucleotide-binding domain-containing protein n=1 Tax=Aquatica leii TaxID=1421715 RepID=A0AAN7Q3R7_9COLE|nr:hypothetical protein RN001_011001 [Aquatica leii]